MVTIPELKSSLRTSTSVVTRVTRRPTGLPVEILNVEFLQVRHELAAQVEHRVLTGPLHQIRLAELESERADHDREIEQRNLAPVPSTDRPRAMHREVSEPGGPREQDTDRSPSSSASGPAICRTELIPRKINEMAT